MIESPSALTSALSGTLLAKRDVIELPILDTGERAYALEISGAEVESAWRAARSVVKETGRWPLVVTYSGGPKGGSTWEERLLDADMFGRFFYEQVSPGQDVSPAAILRAASSVDVSAFLDKLSASRARHWPLERALDVELSDAQYAFGEAAPRRAELEAARIGGAPVSTWDELDRWLLEWERAHERLPAPESGRLSWFDPGIAFLIFLPTSSSWDSLAYMDWYGMAKGAAPYIALGRQWSQRFGAELVANYGTMLQCLVTSPPQTIEEAWELGRQHDLIAPCTLALPGIRLRHYAVGLRGWDRWFLHERP
jgi:hypothetical protein